MKKGVIGLVVFLLAAAGVFTLAGGAAPTYVGSDKCKICHKDQYTPWEASKHSKAWSALKPEEQKKAECIKCHSTDGEGKFPNVGCEACHGPGSEYKSPNIMNKQKWAADPAGQLKLATAAGLVAKPDEKVCVKCHNKQSPTFKGFNFAQMKEKIKHWK